MMKHGNNSELTFAELNLTFNDDFLCKLEVPDLVRLNRKLAFSEVHRLNTAIRNVDTSMNRYSDSLTEQEIMALASFISACENRLAALSRELSRTALT